MKSSLCEVSTIDALVAAAANPTIDAIEITTNLAEVPSITLSPGQRLRGSEGVELRFAKGADGIRLSTDNAVERLIPMTDPERSAVFNDTSVPSFGRLVLSELKTTGCVRILAADEVRSGHVEAVDVDVVEADARSYDRRPAGYGVEVVPGVFMIWNQQPDPAVTITAEMRGIRIGREGAPVRGGGVFVAGADKTGGRLLVSRLETEAVHSDGGIAPGTADRIAGGVFTVSGAVVDVVVNHGPVSTYGLNDMVLDNWGEVDRWIAEEKITSYAPSAIGFVNFGSINELEIKAPIETFGAGSRGFNVYDGVVRNAEFDRVVTHADGAVGIQISRPVQKIVVRRGIETRGGVGPSLVKGVVTQLPATAFSVKPGGSARWVLISGGLKTRGVGIEPLELHGSIESFSVLEGFSAESGGFAGI